MNMRRVVFVNIGFGITEICSQTHNPCESAAASPYQLGRGGANDGDDYDDDDDDGIRLGDESAARCGARVLRSPRSPP